MLSLAHRLQAQSSKKSDYFERYAQKGSVSSCFEAALRLGSETMIGHALETVYIDV